jgi:hypothetical protein
MAKPRARTRQGNLTDGGRNAIGEIVAKMTEELCTVKQAAKILGVSTQQVHVLINEKKIDAVQLDEWFYVVHRPSLIKYLKTKSRRGRPPSGSIH